MSNSKKTTKSANAINSRNILLLALVAILSTSSGVILGSWATKRNINNALAQFLHKEYGYVDPASTRSVYSIQEVAQLMYYYKRMDSLRIISFCREMSGIRASVRNGSAPSFKIDGATSGELIKLLQEIGKINIDPQAKNTIRITYFGELSKIPDSEKYYYRGGSLKITINDQLCSTILTLKLSAQPAGSENSVKSAVNLEVLNHIKENPELLSREILKCINIE